MLGRYIIRRSVAALITLFGVSVLIFFLARVMPGDAAGIALGESATLEQIAAYRERHGFNEPLHIQYWVYVTDVIDGDLGDSLYTGNAVLDDLAFTFPATFELVIFSTILMISIGIPLGVLAGRFRDGYIDNFTRVFSLLGVVTPSFVWAVFFLLAFAFYLKVLPVMGRLSEGIEPPPFVTGLYLIDSLAAGDWAKFRDAFAHIIMPGIALAMASIGQTTRMTRANIGESFEKTYIEFARRTDSTSSDGRRLRPAPGPDSDPDDPRARHRHQVRQRLPGGNGLRWPGMARYGVQVILFKDLNAIVGTVTVIGFFFIIINLIVDIVVAFVDPRIRLGSLAQ